MPWQIWFMPNSPLHVGRFRPLMDALRDRGDDVRLLCADSAFAPAQAAEAQVRTSGYPYEMLPAGVCDPAPHWTRESRERRRLNAAVRKVLEGRGIDAMIFGSDFGPMQREIMRAARQAGLATVYMTDGLVVPANPRYRVKLLRRRKIGIGLFRAALARLGYGALEGNSGVDLTLVMNTLGRDIFLRNGAPPGSVHVVGSPAYDRLAETAREPWPLEEDRAVRRRLGIREDCPIVLFAAQAFDHRPMILDLVPAVRAHGALLLVKFHPRIPEDLDAWRRWADEHGMTTEDVAFFKNELSSIEALRLCSACATVYSTVCIEAMILQKPVVFIQYLKTALALPYAAKYGAGIDVEAPEELRDAIGKVLHDADVRHRLLKNGQEALRDELLGPDGRSMERTLAAIDGVLVRRRGAAAD